MANRPAVHVTGETIAVRRLSAASKSFQIPSTRFNSCKRGEPLSILTVSDVSTKTHHFDDYACQLNRSMQHPSIR
jgi:hypothetical protein